MIERKHKERYGCDSCKEDKPTYLFEHFVMKLWICHECYEELRTSSVGEKQ